jgi:hypothetical protein
VGKTKKKKKKKKKEKREEEEEEKKKKKKNKMKKKKKKKKKKLINLYEMKKNFRYTLKYPNTNFSAEMKIRATNLLHLHCKHRCLALLQLNILKGFLKLRYV